MAGKRTFTSIVQLLLVLLMLLSIILIGQRFEFGGYKAGLILLTITTLSQIAFGNIQPSANFGQAMRMYGIYMGITAVLFALSIAVAPLLVGLGR
ncbi:MAG: hypothetical protein AAF702_08625 [Chloroflexota bacterium]